MRMTLSKEDISICINFIIYFRKIEKALIDG